MSNIRNSRPMPIPSLAELGEMVLQGLIRDQRVDPVLLVYGTQGMEIASPTGGSAEERGRLFHALGADLPAHPIGSLIRLAWVSQAWQTELKPGEVPTVMPRDDIENRIEVVAIQVYNVRENTWEVAIHQVIRDLNDRAINLQLLRSSENSPVKEVQGGVIPKVLEGYNSAMRGMLN